MSITTMRRTTVGCVLIMLATVLCAGPASAQDNKGRPASLKLKKTAFNKGLEPAPATLDRSTPRRSWTSLLGACRSGQFGLAKHLLNLSGIAESARKDKGPVNAKNLCAVLARLGKMELPRQLHPPAEELDDTPEGPLGEKGPRNYVVVLSFEHPNLAGPQEIWLRRLQDSSAARAPAEKSDAGAAAKAAPVVDRYLWVVTTESVAYIRDWNKAVVLDQEIKMAKISEINRGLDALPADLVLTSPRDGATTFGKLCSAGDYDGAARLLDLSAIPVDKQRKKGRRLARRLAMVLKRICPEGFSDLSNEKKGSDETGVPSDREVVAKKKIGDKDLQVRLALYQGKTARDTMWIFSKGTVASTDLLYKELGYGWAGDYLPSMFFEKELWNIQLWQWIGILLALIIGIALGYFLSYLTRRVLGRLATITKWEWDDEVVACMRGPLVIVYVVLVFIILTTSFLALADVPRKFFMGAGKLLVIVAAGWFLVRLVDVAGDIILRLFEDRDDDLGTAMVPVARKILKTFIVAVVLIMALQNMGINVAGLVATLGIGGLAIAMAAKTTLENLLAGITIAFDRPFKMGDYIDVGGVAGTVEDLGLRSTRLRTVNRTIVTIPNSKIVDSKVENYAVRDKLRILTTFGVQYDTSLDQVVFIVDEFKRYLMAHPAVMDGFRVRFVGFSDSSLDIEVVGYINRADFTEFTGIREEIYMELGKIVMASGAEMAYPSQTLYMGKDSHVDADKAKEAVATVARRRAAGELCVPEIPDEVLEKLRKSDVDEVGETKE